MRRLMDVLPAAMLVAFSMAAGQAAADAYTSPDHDFSAAFPADPKVVSHPPASSDAPGDWTYSARSGGGDFTVRVDQYPAGIPVPKPNQRTYELLLAGHARQTASQLESPTLIKVGGLPALQGVFTTAGGGAEKMYVLMSGRRLYQVSYTHAEAAEMARAGDAFLESFKVLGR